MTDSRKLSLIDQVAANRARADKIASSTVEHDSREYWRQVSECGALRSWADGVEAALAQQAQPLKDAEIEVIATRQGYGAFNAERIAFFKGAVAARDRMAQQAQPTREQAVEPVMPCPEEDQRDNTPGSDGKDGHWLPNGDWFCNTCQAEYHPDSFHARFQERP